MMGGCTGEHRAGRERTEPTAGEQDGGFGSCSEKLKAGDFILCIPGDCKVAMGRGRPLRTVIKHNDEGLSKAVAARVKKRWPMQRCYFSGFSLSNLMPGWMWG